MESVTNSSIDWPCAALQSAELGPRTTLKVGGRAEWLLEPATPEELVAFRHGGILHYVLRHLAGLT